ncbi:MAG: hypothetical protein PVH25_07075 [Burkholderiales bacterium]
MFKRYSFAFSTTIDKALARLDAAVGTGNGFELAVDANGRVKLYRSQGFALLNGFFPVFVGRFHTANAHVELRGGFRFHLVAIALFAGFVATSALSLVNLLTSPEAAAGMPEGWKLQRIRFELQFIAFASLAAFFAWLAGKPIRERITSIIDSARVRNGPVKTGGDN